VPEGVVPDNVRTAVSKACRHEPDLNPTYQEMAMHYGAGVVPARVRKPRDKAKLEIGVPAHPYPPLGCNQNSAKFRAMPRQSPSSVGSGELARPSAILGNDCPCQLRLQYRTPDSSDV
jgi:hypothetical protein